jgi:hypothetical protein
MHFDGTKRIYGQLFRQANFEQLIPSFQLLSPFFLDNSKQLQFPVNYSKRFADAISAGALGETFHQEEATYHPNLTYCFSQN